MNLRRTLKASLNKNLLKGGRTSNEALMFQEDH